MVVALSWFSPHAATSQGPTYPDPIPIYGFDVDEFIIGTWITKWALPDTADESTREICLIWPFVDSLGPNVIFVNGRLER